MVMPEPMTRCFKSQISSLSPDTISSKESSPELSDELGYFGEEFSSKVSLASITLSFAEVSE